MASSRIVSIIGATGNQGASVVDALLKDGTFTPRAITRDPDSEASKKLKARGVDVVKGDTADKASLVSALQGSEGVFGVTLSVWSPDALSEQTHGRNIIDASKEIGAKFFVFSSTPNLTKLSGGKYKVSIYDDKADIEEYLKASGLANASLHLGGFAETLTDQSRPRLKKTDTGFDMAVPRYSATALEAWTWVGHDVGQAALALFKNYTDPSKNISGKVYPVVTAELTFPDLATMISKALGVEVTFTSVPTCGIPMIDEMFAAHAEYNGLYTSTPVPNPDLVALGAKFGTMEEFVETEIKKRFG
ncbi:hypothetical protein B0H16DRAFT_1712658 [Mycena metata]|uniref:NmrA-like domain-containing protein n=1 Tax=Mycena metata TaxID=1033252 RepID=A0AAD7NV15_9AGAR|nr:hypothetical protein B0H16DRAFT_1712658 [Mycena metata]